MTNAKAGLPTEITDDILMVIVCNRMGWTYQQYLTQPTFFITDLLHLWSAQGKDGAL